MSDMSVLESLLVSSESENETDNIDPTYDPNDETQNSFTKKWHKIYR